MAKQTNGEMARWARVLLMVLAVTVAATLYIVTTATQASSNCDRIEKLETQMEVIRQIDRRVIRIEAMLKAREGESP